MNQPEPLPSELAEPLERAAAGLGPFAGRLIWYPELSSTNDAATALAERDAAEGTVVVANAQTAGRGRHGRSWTSPPGAGLYVSAVLRPDHCMVPLVTIAAGVAVAEGIQAATGLRAHLKWPNDIYAGPRKLAGVLAEASTNVHGPSVRYVVVGFGVNVMPAAYPPDVAARATSVEGELGRAVDRGTLLAECLAALARRYAELGDRRRADVLAAWRTRAATTLGRKVRVDASGVPVDGVAEDIDEAGALIVRTRAGAIRVLSGEVQWT